MAQGRRNRIIQAASGLPLTPRDLAEDSKTNLNRGLHIWVWDLRLEPRKALFPLVSEIGLPWSYSKLARSLALMGYIWPKFDFHPQ